MVGAIVGIALSVAGVVLQGLLRNPMVDPYIMGISAGASLGASLVIAFGIGLSVFGVLYSLPVISFVFALGTVFLVYSVAKSSHGLPMLNLLLVRIAINSLFLAVVAAIRVVSGEAFSVIMAWLFGTLVNCNWNHVIMTLPFVGLGVLVIYIFARDLNVIGLGEE